MKIQSSSPIAGQNALSVVAPTQGADTKQTATPTSEPTVSASKNTPHLVINGQGVSIQFSTDPGTGRTIIQIVDSDSGEVVRQIPPEEALNFLRKIASKKGTLFSRSF